MGRYPLINAIEHATHHIYLTMYGLTDPTLIDALIKQKKRGCDVKVILEKAPYRTTKENQKAIQILKANGVLTHLHDQPHQYMHQKTLIIDGHSAWIMTFNFTHTTFKRLRNFAFITNDSSLIQDLTLQFLADWNQTLPPPHQSALTFSPLDSRTKLSSWISGAKESLDLYAPTLSDRDILRALITKAKSGCQIRILSINTSPKVMRILNKAGIHIERAKHYHVHAKIGVIDHRLAWIGSINLTRHSLDYNHECAVMTKNPEVVSSLQRVFENDWSEH